MYSVGKTSDGKKQQVVPQPRRDREQPAHRESDVWAHDYEYVMQAVSAFKPIITTFPDGLPTGQPSISEFIRQNYALVKADALAHPASGNKFGLVKYQEKGAKIGEFKMSKGSAIVLLWR